MVSKGDRKGSFNFMFDNFFVLFFNFYMIACILRGDL